MTFGSREDALDAVADVLRALARAERKGIAGDRAILTVRADGRAELVVEDGRGFVLLRREGDTLPGGPLPTLGRAMAGVT